MDGGDTVVVTDSENNRLQLLNAANGQSLGFVRPSGTPKFSRPHQTAVAGDGTFWVADTGNDRVLHLDLGGNEIEEISGLPAPRGVAVNGGSIYVSYNQGVREFNAAGTQLGVIASTGSGAQEVSQPYGLRTATLDGGQVLLVADRGHDRILVFDLDGLHPLLATVGGGLTEPQGADARNNGRIAVANFGRNRVSLWNS